MTPFFKNDTLYDTLKKRVSFCILLFMRAFMVMTFIFFLLFFCKMTPLTPFLRNSKKLRVFF